LATTARIFDTTILSRADLFKDLPPQCLKALEARGETRDFRAKHVFFRSGESGQRLFFLERGRVRTFRTSGSKKLVIAELKPPAIFGEMALVGQYMYHCSAETIEPSRICIIERNDLDSLLDEYPVLTRRLLELVGERFVRVLRDLESTSFQQLLPRVAALLLDRVEGDSIEGLTHQAIADRLSVYRESVSAALGELRKAGIIEVDRKRIRVLNRGRLERASRE